MSSATRIGSSYNEHAKAYTYSPLTASLAETGNMVGDLLLEGNPIRRMMSILGIPAKASFD